MFVLAYFLFFWVVLFWVLQIPQDRNQTDLGLWEEQEEEQKSAAGSEGRIRAGGWKRRNKNHESLGKNLGKPRAEEENSVSF